MIKFQRLRFVRIPDFKRNQVQALIRFQRLRYHFQRLRSGNFPEIKVKVSEGNVHFPQVKIQIVNMCDFFPPSINGDLFTHQCLGDCRRCLDNTPAPPKDNALTHIEDNVIIASDLISPMSNTSVKDPHKILRTFGPHNCTIQGGVCKRRKVFQYPLRRAMVVFIHQLCLSDRKRER